MLRLENNSLSDYSLLFYLIITLLSLCVIIDGLNSYQDFTVSKEGIKFQVFNFLQKFIPWEEIGSIKQLNDPWKTSLGVFDVRYHVIFTKRLTPFHRIIGLLRGNSFKPAFIIHQDLENYDEAIELIQERLNQS